MREVDLNVGTTVFALLLPIRRASSICSSKS